MDDSSTEKQKIKSKAGPPHLTHRVKAVYLKKIEIWDILQMFGTQRKVFLGKKCFGFCKIWNYYS